jgi:hypothetical protein
MTAGLSGVVATKAPGNMVRRYSGYGFGVDSKRTKSRLAAVIAGNDGIVPLDLGCLLLCQLAGVAVDIGSELMALDTLADSIDSATFDGVVTALFAGPQPLRGNPDAYYSVDNSLLSEVRRTGLGIPISLSVLAMEVGRRKGVAIAGIGMPGHFLIADGATAGRYADPFNGVRVFDGDGARALFHRMAGQQAAWHDGYLAPTGNRDILFRIVNNIKVACTKGFAERRHLPWVLEVLSWFPQGQPFDSSIASRSVAPFN